MNGFPELILRGMYIVDNKYKWRINNERIMYCVVFDVRSACSITDSVPALYHRSIRLYVLLHFWKVKIHCLLLRKRIEIFKEIDVCLFNIVQTF